MQVRGKRQGIFRRMGRFTALIAASLLVAPDLAVAIPSPFFTAHVRGFSNLSAFVKWTSVLPRYEQERLAGPEDCRNCAAKRWEHMLGELKNRPLSEQMEQVNRFFNQFRYIEDRDNFGVEDYWQTPYELMMNGGDCEDYAIAKYISLKRLGVPEADMRLIIVRDDRLGGIIHAVLEVRAGNAHYLLDNQSRTVLTRNEVFHYRPIYALNAQGWWAYQ